MHREDQRILARIVVEHRFGRRVGQNAAIPIQLAVDPDSGERRRQRAGRHDVLDAEFAITAVEIPHLAGADMGGADGQPRPATVDQIEIDQFGQGLLQRLGGVVSGPLGTERIVVAGVGQRIGPEEPGNAVDHGRPVGQLFIEAGKRARKAPDRTLLHPLPEFLQARQAVFRRIAGDQAGIDGADRGADDPVRLDAGFVQRLIDAGLIGSQRAAALQHQHDLAGQCLAQRLQVMRRPLVMSVFHVSLPFDACDRHVRGRIRFRCVDIRFSARSSRRRPAARCR